MTQTEARLQCKPRVQALKAENLCGAASEYFQQPKPRHNQQTEC